MQARGQVARNQRPSVRHHRLVKEASRGLKGHLPLCWTGCFGESPQNSDIFHEENGKELFQHLKCLCIYIYMRPQRVWKLSCFLTVMYVLVHLEVTGSQSLASGHLACDWLDSADPKALKSA